MDADWFCQMAGREYGPLNLEQIRRMVARGQVTLDSLVRQGKDGEWIPAQQVPGLFMMPVARVVGYAATAPAPAVVTPVSPVPVSQVSVVPIAAPPGSPLPVGLPVGVAVAPVAAVSVVPVGQPAISVASFAPETKTGTKAVRVRKRKDPLPMILIGGAGVALVVVAIVAVSMLSGGSGSAKVAKTSGSKTTTAEQTGANQPTPSSASDDDQRDGAKTPAAATTKSKTATMSVEKILDSIERWTDATKSRKLQGKSFQVQLVGVWDGPDGLCLEMQIKNPPTAGGTLTYSGWNRTSGTLAVLADDAGQTFALLPVKGGDTERKTSPVKLRPGQAVEDVLVFAKPPDDVENLRLALSYEVVGQGGDRYFGFKIPKSMVSDERPTPELASSDMPDSRATADRAPRDPNEPPSLAEIQKRMEADVKADEAAQEQASKARSAAREKAAQEMDAKEKDAKEKDAEKPAKKGSQAVSPK